MSVSQFIVLGLLLLGCDAPVFEHPLVKVENAKRADRFNGVFKRTDDAKSVLWLHIGNSGSDFPSGFHDIIGVLPDPGKNLYSHRYRGFFDRIEDVYYLHIPIDKNLKKSDTQQFAKGWKPSQVGQYSIYAIFPNESGFSARNLNYAYFSEMIESGKLDGVIERAEDLKEDAPRVTVGTEGLRKFLIESPRTKLFGEKEYQFTKMD